MAVTIKVNGETNSLVHRGSNGVSAGTLPDVCKTPSPGGPVPIPYPNVSRSASLAKGTTTVKADGGMMIAVKGSEFSLSTGDEPGTVGGVKSSTFIKESTWILYSFDVKMEGKNACRLTDKKFQNHENTVDVGGEVQSSAAVKGLEDMVCECHEEVKAGPTDTCRSLGDARHRCMENKISQHEPPPTLQGEKCYNRRTGREVPNNPRKMQVDEFGVAESFRQFMQRISGHIYPDGAILDDSGRPTQFVEFKFRCDAGVPTRLGAGPSQGRSTQDWSSGQLERTMLLGAKQDPPVTSDPALITNETC